MQVRFESGLEWIPESNLEIIDTYEDAFELLLRFSPYVVNTHDSGRPIHTTRQAFLAQFVADPRTAITAVASLVDGFDLNEQSLILIVSPAPPTPSPGIETAPGHAQYPTQRAHRMLFSLALYERILHRGRGVIRRLEIGYRRPFLSGRRQNSTGLPVDE